MNPGDREVPRAQSGETPSGPPPSDDALLRPPTADDGLRMWEIARDSGVLDLNSEYAYALWGAEFADTSVVVESGGRVVGYVTGFLRPSEPDSVFVWQVGVDADQRGKGLAARMIHELMDRMRPRGVVRLRTTISPDNEASQRTFGAVARDRGMQLGREDYLGAAQLGKDDLQEDLYTIS